MPQAPEQYKAPQSQVSENVEKFSPPSKKKRSSGPNEYSHRRYRKWRSRMKKKQRLKDEEQIHQIYSNIGQTVDDYKDYLFWLSNDNPLCVHCLDNENIMPGRVLDHIQPIKQGGAKHDEDNIQWLCDHHHAIKSATDDKQGGGC